VFVVQGLEAAQFATSFTLSQARDVAYWPILLQKSVEGCREQ
jgi:hypothetical protein